MTGLIRDSEMSRYTHIYILFQLLANVSWRGVAQEQFWVRISQVFSSRTREKSQIYAYLHAHPPTWNNTLRIRLRLIPFLLGCVRFRAIGRDTRQFRNSSFQAFAWRVRTYRFRTSRLYYTVDCRLSNHSEIIMIILFRRKTFFIGEENCKLQHEVH